MEGQIKGLIKNIYLALLLAILLAPLPSSGSSSKELLQVGTGAFKDGFYQVAEAQFREFLQLYPGHRQVPRVMYLLGKALYEQKKFAEAKGVFEKLLYAKKNFKEREAVYFWLARSCEELNDLTCAKKGFLVIIERYPKSPWYLSSLYLLGKISFQEDQFKRSEEYLRKALGKDCKIAAPLSCHVKFWLGLTLYEQGKYKEAEDSFHEAVSSVFKDGPLEETLYWLGETKIKLKKYKEGAETFSSLLSDFPQSPLTPNALYGKSWCLYMYEMKEEALKGLLTLQRGFPHSPLFPQVLSLMGEIYMGLDRYQEAIEVFKEVLSRFPKDPIKGQILLNLGWCYLQIGDLHRLKEIAFEIVKLPPGERERDLAQYILGELNSYEGKCQEALPYWFNLLNVTPYRQYALFNIALCSFNEGRFKESLVNLDLLQLEYPNFKKMDEALWIKGESFRELRNLSEASRAYQSIIKQYKRSPWYPWCVYRMMLILLDKGDLDRGERWFHILHRKFPYHKLSYEAALKLGIRKVESVKYESSLRYLDIAVRSPDRGVAQNALCWQGEIYFNLKEYQKALSCYQRAIGEKPTKGDACAAVAYLETGNIKHLLGDQKGAKEAYKKALHISGDKEFIDKVKGLLKELTEAMEEGH